MRMRMFSSFENMSSAGQKTAVLGTHCFPSCQRWNRIVRYSFLKNRNPHARMSSVTHTIHFRLGASEPIFWNKIQSAAIAKKLQFGVFVHLSVSSIEQVDIFSPTKLEFYDADQVDDSPGYVVGWKINTRTVNHERMSFRFSREKNKKQNKTNLAKAW